MELKFIKINHLLLIFTFYVLSGAHEALGFRKRVHMGSFGYNCTNNCDNHGYDYFWCEAEHPTEPLPGVSYWDYCSQKEGFDYKGNQCTYTHGCGNHGYKYKWCYIDEDKNWGYCGYDVSWTVSTEP